jgi:hypothetical protein
MSRTVEPGRKQRPSTHRVSTMVTPAAPVVE